MVMCVRLGDRALLPLLFARVAVGLAIAGALGLSPVRPASAQLLEGLEHWADTTVGLSSSKWSGPRVPFPTPRARPSFSQRLSSRDWPVSVFGGPEVAPARLVQVLAAAEATHALLSVSGFLTSFGDAGQGGTGGRDLYLVDDMSRSASAAVDASGSLGPLDGARAFALLDARLPSDRLLACTAEGLLQAQLLELDPAEAEVMRASSAAYFARLIAGEPCQDTPAQASESNPFASESAGADWLALLSRRQDQDRGTFLFDMWQFARQRTWEGQDLRASPTLMEAIGKALELERESFTLVAAELAESAASAHPERVQTLPWSALPWFSPKQEPPLNVLGSKQVRLVVSGAHAGSRLRVWSRGEPGGVYTLSATRLDAAGNTLARLELEPRRDPVSQLSVELDAQTHVVAISVARFADLGVPVAQAFSSLDVRPVHITIDSSQ